MSFLADPPLLYLSGQAYGRGAPEQAHSPSTVRVAAVTTLCIFWGTSVSLYLERPWTRPMWRILRAKSGRDWMINSGVTRFDAGRAGWPVHLLGLVIFATYPLWLALGYRHGRSGARLGRPGAR